MKVKCLLCDREEKVEDKLTPPPKPGVAIFTHARAEQIFPVEPDFHWLCLDCVKLNPDVGRVRFCQQGFRDQFLVHILGPELEPISDLQFHDGSLASMLGRLQLSGTIDIAAEVQDQIVDLCGLKVHEYDPFFPGLPYHQPPQEALPASIPNSVQIVVMLAIVAILTVLAVMAFLN